MIKNIICLFAASSMMFAAGAQENTPDVDDSNDATSQYSEQGYKRPGASQPKFAEAFLNSEKDSSSKEEPGAADSQDSPQGAAPTSRDYDNDFSDLIKQACRLGVFVIRQPYGVVDNNGDFYALEEGKQEIGATYSPGYYIKGGYLFTEASLSPWNYDPTFSDLVDPGLMGSLLNKTTSADLSAEAEYDDITFTASSRGNVYPGLLYSMPDKSPFAADGFYASSEPGDHDGYIVWLTKTSSQDLSTDTDLMITVSRKPMTVTDDPAKLYFLGRGVTNAVGVIYVTPEITGVGRVDLYLQGVGVEKDGEWSLIFPFTDFSKIFDEEQAVKAPVADPGRKLSKLKKITTTKAEAPADEAEKAEKAEAVTEGKTEAAEPESSEPESSEPEETEPEETDDETPQQ